MKVWNPKLLTQGHRLLPKVETDKINETANENSHFMKIWPP